MSDDDETVPYRVCAKSTLLLASNSGEFIGFLSAKPHYAGVKGFESKQIGRHGHSQGQYSVPHSEDNDVELSV